MNCMGIEVAVIFAFLAMICWGLGDFLIQRCTRKVGNVEALAIIGIFGSIALAPFIIKELPLLNSLPNIILLSFLGIVTFIAAIFDFEALKEGKLSVVDIVIEIELPVTIILGFIFFKETLSSLQLIVISFLFLGLILIASQSLKHLKLKLEKGVFIAFIAAILMGGINFLTASSSRQISPLMAIWVPWIIFTVICVVYIWKREGFGKFIKNTKKFKFILLGMAIFDTSAWLCYAYATQTAEISIITSITEAYPAIALFLGLWINKESIGWHQYTGAGVALVASFILGFLI